MSFLFINANQSVGTINKNIYGQFSEHLGRCIYGGVANRDGGLRADVVAALKALGVDRKSACRERGQKYGDAEARQGKTERGGGERGRSRGSREEGRGNEE